MGYANNPKSPLRNPFRIPYRENKTNQKFGWFEICLYLCREIKKQENQMKNINAVEEMLVDEINWSDDELIQSAHIGKIQYQEGNVVTASEAIAHFRAL